jgi:hypothetical protein
MVRRIRCNLSSVGSRYEAAAVALRDPNSNLVFSFLVFSFMLNRHWLQTPGS